MLAFADDPGDVRFAADLGRHCASAAAVALDTRAAKLRALAALAGSGSLSLAYFRHPAMTRAVAGRDRATLPDAVVVYSSPMAQYVPAELRRRTLVDLVDVDSEKWNDYAASHHWPMSVLYGIESRRLLSVELQLVRGFGGTVLATEREAAILRPHLDPTAACRLSVLVNGVDLEHYRPAIPPDPGSVPPAERRFFGPGGPRVVFTGAMDYYANVDGVTWFARDAWPAIRSAHPGALFLIVGAKPAPAVAALAEIPGVIVTGFVEDVRPYLWSADVCVAPLRIARGVQNKVLEACACGRPVVATCEAVAGLAMASGRDVLVADDGPGMAAAVLKVLVGGAAADALAAAGRRYVEREHSWGEMTARLGGLVEALVENGES